MSTVMQCDLCGGIEDPSVGSGSDVFIEPTGENDHRNIKDVCTECLNRLHDLCDEMEE